MISLNIGTESPGKDPRLGKAKTAKINVQTGTDVDSSISLGDIVRTFLFCTINFF